MRMTQAPSTLVLEQHLVSDASVKDRSKLSPGAAPARAPRAAISRDLALQRAEINIWPRQLSFVVAWDEALHDGEALRVVGSSHTVIISAQPSPARRNEDSRKQLGQRKGREVRRAFLG